MSAESDAPSGGAVGSPCAPMPALRPKEARFARCGRPIAKFALLCGTGALWAAQASAQADTGPDEGATIVVIGQRAWLDDLPPERSLDESEVEAYGVDTVEDLLGEIGAELGDDEQPVIIVNGERVESLDDIAGYPTEAVRELQVLPRGSGAPVGGSPRQRVYSIVLRDRVRSLAVNAAWRVATEGDWTGRRGEATLTRIKGPDRFNLTLRARDEDDLLECERGIVQPSLDVP